VTAPSGPVSPDLGFRQPGENVPSRVAIRITRTHRDYRKMRMYRRQQLRNCGSGAAVVGHLEQIRLRLLLGHSLLGVSFRVSFQQN